MSKKDPNYTYRLVADLIRRHPEWKEAFKKELSYSVLKRDILKHTKKMGGEKLGQIVFSYQAGITGVSGFNIFAHINDRKDVKDILQEIAALCLAQAVLGQLRFQSPLYPKM